MSSSATVAARRRRARSLSGLAAAVLTTLASLAMVADTTSAQVACRNAQYRTGPATNLPDCRAYEKVSPDDKGGSDINPGALGGAQLLGASGVDPAPRFPTQIWQAAEDGDAIEYASRGGFAGAQSGVPLIPYIARRSQGGWVTRSISAPLGPTPASAGNLSTKNQYVAFSPDLSVGALLDLGVNRPLTPNAVAGYPNLYLRDNATGTYTALTTTTPPNVSPHQAINTYYPYFQGASADYSHVVFVAPDALTPNAPVPCNHCFDLYEWHDGDLSLVNVLPNGTPTTDAGAGSHQGPASMSNNGGIVTGAVSRDGSRIYWTDSHAGVGDIYVRVDGTQTVAVGSGLFWGASPDGAHAIYTKVTSGFNPAGELYRFDLASGTSTDLTPGSPVQGVVGASTDLSYIYFVAEGSLATGATSGEPNLYLYHAGSGITFIATLPAGEGAAYTSDRTIDNTSPRYRVSYVTPNGHYLAFTSAGSLTGYPNTPIDPQSCVGINLTPVPCTEVFYYNALSGKLVCASCKRSGVPPTGPSGVVPWQNQNYDPRSISDDGSRLFFESWDKLVPGDTNAQQDVYEWEPEGAGGCGTSRGCTHLISGGTGGEPDFTATYAPLNFFVDATPSGGDVFFTTLQQLVPGDRDGASDLYDARVDGGLPAPAAISPCGATTCKGALSPAPPAPPNASRGVKGAGNSASPQNTAAVFHVRRLTRRQRRRLANGRRVALRVRVSKPGRVRVVARGRFRRSHRRSRVRRVAHATRVARRGGTLRVRLKLTRRAQRYLRHHRRLRVAIRVRYSKASGAQRMKLKLRSQGSRGPRHRGRSARGGQR